MFDSQPEGLGVAFFATGPGLGLIMYILTTLEFPKHNHDFHLLTTSVNAKYYYMFIILTAFGLLINFMMSIVRIFHLYSILGGLNWRNNNLIKYFHYFLMFPISWIIGASPGASPLVRSSSAASSVLVRPGSSYSPFFPVVF